MSYNGNMDLFTHNVVGALASPASGGGYIRYQYGCALLEDLLFVEGGFNQSARDTTHFRVSLFGGKPYIYYQQRTWTFCLLCF